MRRTALALPTAIAILALSLTGCGGSDDTDAGGGDASSASTAASADISKDDFVTQANAICTAGNADIATASQELDQTDPDAITTFATETLVPGVRGQLEAIRALGFPADDADMLDSLLSDADGVLDQIEADPNVLGSDPFADVNTQLIDYGLDACGSSDS